MMMTHIQMYEYPYVPFVLLCVTTLGKHCVNYDVTLSFMYAYIPRGFISECI